jgi:GTP-binding protein HflX
LIQRRDKPEPSPYLGSGKLIELRQIVVATGADTVVCDGELSPSQLRTLEEKLKVKVVDRVALILDIFAQHAKSKEGKAQVELAQIAYLLPRLRGWGDSLSRQVGGRAAGGAGIGGRGPGETKIETDRRRIRDKMAKLRKEIAEMKTSRDTKRQERKRFNIPSVAIAGYTNAGKSSLLNALTGAGVLVENALFATLDPTVRKCQTAEGRVYTLSDTVGFVRHLPHQLIDAFKSTLEEVSGADLIVHVVDGSHSDPFEQIRAVREVINEIGGGEIPEIIAINKVDIASPDVVMEILRKEPNSYAFSVRSGFGLEGLIHAIEKSLPHPSVEITAVIPYNRGDLVSAIHERGEILSEEHLAKGTSIHAYVDGGLARSIETATQIAPS